MLQRYAGWNNDPHPAGAFVRYAEHKTEIAALETRCQRVEDALRELGKQVAPACYEYNHRGDIRPMVNVLNAVIAAADALPKAGGEEG